MQASSSALWKNG